MRREEDVSIDRSGSLSLGTAAHEMMRNGYPYQNLSRIARGRGKPFSGPLSLLQDFTFLCDSEAGARFGPTHVKIAARAARRVFRVSQQTSTVNTSNPLLSEFNSISIRLLAPSTYRSQLIVVDARDCDSFHLACA